MKTLMFETENGDMLPELVYNVKDFPYAECLLGVKTVAKNDTISYLNAANVFDIETSLINNEDMPFSFMYHWQICINDKYVCFGRRWEEFIYFIDRIKTEHELGGRKYIIIYIQNAGYEFSFIQYLIGELKKLFCVDTRQPLFFRIEGIEFRCMWKLTNMALDKALKYDKNVIHKKKDGETYDYSVIRTPSTVMSNYELQYCYADVKGAAEHLTTLMKEDTLATIPYTSTGYIRREARAYMNRNKKNFYAFQKTRLNVVLYEFMVKIFRGGNTHANRKYANKILINVYNADISSSYPAQICMSDRFPIGSFLKYQFSSIDDYLAQMKSGNYAAVMKLAIMNPNLKSEYGMPYIDLGHCDKTSGIVNDNGRVLSAAYVEYYCTNIDLDIIMRQYHYDKIYILDCYIAKAGKLPYELRLFVSELFNKKTQLKYDDYLYMKSKNKLNAVFGMMVSAILHAIIELNDGNWDKKELEDFAKKAELLEKYYSNRNNFLSYQWGVFTTALAREEQALMMDKLGSKNVVYGDTDSAKFLGKENILLFEERNKYLIERARKCDVPCTSTYDGKEYILGIWEMEKPYLKFKTLGAKKYCAEYRNKKDENVFEITVAGMSKEKGAKEIAYFPDFVIGARFHDIGRTTAFYNNWSPFKVKINGEDVIATSNLAITDTTYKLGLSDEYFDLVDKNCGFSIDNIEKIMYNN